MTKEELDRRARGAIDPAAQGSGGEGTMMVFGYETLHRRVQDALAVAHTKGLEDALLIAETVIMRGVLNHPIASMKPTEIKEARDDMHAGIHKVMEAIREVVAEAKRQTEEDE